MPSRPHFLTRLRRKELGIAILVCLLPTALTAQGVPVEEAAKFLLILANSAGSEGRVACKELDMVMQLKKSEISVDAKANVAWSFTPEQTKFYAGQGKLVVCSSRKLFAEGGVIAFERINGRLTIFVHQANLGRSGVTLPDSFLRIAVKQ
ncbi:MAG: hypothetical protein HXX12_01625 [Geothrix sp.]|uniref:hypothetical protein n=1 Tax=Geothrix sp. TaxID=1962974 RepID=UPI001852DB49|nr:hypothetical protein [Geothrix sp.]NWJ39652.1 hypothetical protein [Geothrix sp.]WIL22328.1 MAG: YfiR family protein [Geothrix sp.]